MQAHRLNLGTNVKGVRDYLHTMTVLVPEKEFNLPECVLGLVCTSQRKENSLILPATGNEPRLPIL
jgi:hypothetical protein